MEIKGTAVKSIRDFVLRNYPDQLDEWFNSLSKASQEVFNNALTNGWYPLQEGVVEPTEKIGKLFFNGDTKKGAFECGRYSANIALNGIYKLYVKFSSPAHVVDRGSRILPAYYKPSVITQLVREKNFVKFKMDECEGIDEVIEYRIAGWMYQALEISGCDTKEIKVSESIKTHGRTIFDCSWS
jgi:hypothetical protein